MKLKIEIDIGCRTTGDRLTADQISEILTPIVVSAADADPLYRTIFDNCERPIGSAHVYHEPTKCGRCGRELHPAFDECPCVHECP